MYFNGVDYYFFGGVKSVFRNMLHDNDIDNKDIIFVLKTKNFPFKSILRSINGKEKVIGIYNKAVINSYFSTKEKREEIKRIIEYLSEDEIQKIIDELPKKKALSSTQTKNENKEKMIDYLDLSPEEDMDYVSRQLLIDDGVMYEGKNETLSDVETEWKPKEGLFLSKSPKGIANYLLKHSKNKSQAMKRLTFYMNRAGENLSNKTVLNKVKELLKAKE